METILAPWKLEHTAAVHAACSDPSISERLPVTPPYTLEHAHALVTEVAPEFVLAGGSNCAVLDSDGCLLGCVSAWPVAPGTVRMGYWVAPWARRRGVASSALTQMTRWAAWAGYRTGELTIAADNERSLAVAHHGGFVQVEVIADHLLGRRRVDTVRLQRAL